MYKCQKCQKTFDKAKRVKDELCGGTMQTCPFCGTRVYPTQTILGVVKGFLKRLGGIR